MRRNQVTDMLFMLLGLALVSGCGLTRGSRPIPPVEIPLRAEIALPCVALAAPPESALPALSDEPAIRGVQIAEREYWMDGDTETQVAFANVCARNRELVGLIEAHNQGVRALRGRAAE